MACIDKLLPQRVMQKIGGREIQKIDLGRSGCEVYYVKNYGYIKISADIDSLTSEKDRCLWLENRVIAPQVLDFGKCTYFEENTPSRAFLLTSEVKGLPLCDEGFISEPRRLIALLSEAMALFHSLDTKDCPFIAEGCAEYFENNENNENNENGENGEKPEKLLLCHGDFCLPNILYDGKHLGFVDLGGMGKGDPWLDYAWSLWSLDYNLKTEAFRPELLKALGIEFNEKKYRRYIEIS